MSVPAAEIESRLQRMRSLMRCDKLGGVVLTREEDIHYLSGFTGRDSILLVFRAELHLITDFRYQEEAEKSAPLAETVIWKGGLHYFAGELARKRRITRLGFCADAITVADHRALRRGGRGLKHTDIAALVQSLRAVKSSWEIRKIRKALRCAENSFLAVRKRIRAGQSEQDLRLDLEWEMRRRGASAPAFETIVAAGANASRPHAHAGTRKLKKGGLVLIDFGARVDGYNSDLTRVLFLGSIPRSWKHRYERVLQAQEAGIDAVRPGTACKEADKAARQVFAADACEKRFGHSLGHGVGLAVHEQPRLASKNASVLEPGMVVTVEPGLYYPRQGGIRIEDMVQVTARGNRVLSSLEKTLDWAVI